MANLKESLLKAGLISKKKLKEEEAKSKKQNYDAQKNATAAKELEELKRQEEAQIEALRQEKVHQDRLRNLEIEAARKEKERWYRAWQLIRSNRLNEPRAQERYYFVHQENKIRRIEVTPYQREMLARGLYGIAVADHDPDDFILIPMHTAKTLLEIAPQSVLVLHPPIDDSTDLS